MSRQKPQTPPAAGEQEMYGASPAAGNLSTPDYIARIRLGYSEMHEAERQVADYFLQRSAEEPLSDSVKELAARTGVSVATVMRFCQHLGYSGYAEFKMLLNNAGYVPQFGNIRLDPDMTAAELKRDICSFSVSMLTKCIDAIDDEALSGAVDAIRKARLVMVFGLGIAAGIAGSAANTFMNLSIHCFPLTDDLFALRTLACCGPEDVLIVIGNTGQGKPLVDAMKVAQDAGVRNILITGRRQSLAAKYSDIVLCSDTSGVTGVLDMMTVTISQMMILQILQAGCMMRSSGDVLGKIKQNAALLNMSRYSEKVTEVKEAPVRN